MYDEIYRKIGNEVKNTDIIHNRKFRLRAHLERPIKCDRIADRFYFNSISSYRSFKVSLNIDTIKFMDNFQQRFKIRNY